MPVSALPPAPCMPQPPHPLSRLRCCTSPNPTALPLRPTPPQVATDTRLWLYGQLQLVRAALRELIEAAADRAEAEVDVLMPGFTHLQPAQVRIWWWWWAWLAGRGRNTCRTAAAAVPRRWYQRARPARPLCRAQHSDEEPTLLALLAACAPLCSPADGAVEPLAAEPRCVVAA